MTNLSRRGLFGGLGAILICAPAVVRASSLMPLGDPRFFTAAQSWDVDRIAAIISARLDAAPDSDWTWTAQEVEAHKRAGGWPEYGTNGDRMQGPRLSRGQLFLENI